MKTRAILASTAMILASFVPVLNGSALAAVTILDTSPPEAEGASAANLVAMTQQCIDKATAHGSGWTGELDETSIVASWVSGPTEVAGTRVIDESTIVGAGTFTPGHVEFTSDPYRNGGSVNMWANANAVGGHYSASAYDFNADFTTTYSYAFNCTMSEMVHHDAEGAYEIEDNYHGSDEEAVRANCPNFTDHSQPWWGLPHANCKFVGTPAEDVLENRDDEAGTPINQEQTDNLLAHESAGEGFDITETVSIGKVLVCISPTTSAQSKKGAPGTWVAMHGYSGEKCTTLWYNTGATVNVSNLNTGSNNVVTVPIDLP